MDDPRQDPDTKASGAAGEAGAAAVGRRLHGAELRRWEARATVVKAMAHPSRLFLLDQLAHGERCVCDLTAMVGADVSTVSKHLAVLRGAGLVADERRGNQVFYRLRMPCALGVFGCIDGVLAGDAAAREAVVGELPAPAVLPGPVEALP